MDRSFEALLVSQCSPTLAGVKPANLFSCRLSDPTAFARDVSHWSAQLSPRGISIRLLKQCGQTGAALVYVYRRKWLDAILAREDVRAFLARTGYTGASDTGSLLEQLSLRVCAKREFPHEIGVFLGYPLEDVVGFIDNKGRNFTCCGCWKTYGDPAEAEKRFRLYAKCTSVYQRLFARGTPILRLAVAA